MPILHKCTGLTRPGAISVFIAVPTYGDLKAAFVRSIWSSQYALAAANISADFYMLAGGCHVDDARNQLVREFLETECQQLIFIDADIGFDPVDLVRLIRHNRDVVGGTYPLKQDEADYPVRPLNEQLTSELDGLVEVEGLPTGFLKINRRVFESLAEGANTHIARKDKKGQLPIPIIFERTFENGKRYSGDYAFCRKWRAKGGKIYLDPEMAFEHVGDNLWQGYYGKHVRLINRRCIPNMIKAIEQGTENEKIIDEAREEWGNIGFIADAQYILSLILVARECKGKILETGSGLSTIALAVANPGVEIVSIEADKFWCDTMKAMLIRYGINNVNLVHSKIKDFGEYSWYDYDTGGSKFELFACDGPNHAVNGYRNGAINWLSLSDKAIFHDVEDESIMKLVERTSKYSIIGEERKTAVCVVNETLNN